MRYREIDWFNPYILILLLILFVIISLPIHFKSRPLLPFPSNQLFLYVLIGMIFLSSGIESSRYILKKSKTLKNIKKLSSDVYSKEDNTKNITDYRISLKELPLFGNYSRIESALIVLILFSLVLQLINFYNLGGIPLFSGYLKSKAATRIWFLSFMIFLPSINILLSKYNRKTHYVLLFLGLLCFALTGYRTTPIAILLSSFITIFYTRNISRKTKILFVALIIILLLAIGFIAVRSIEWQHWTLNPLELISYRAAFTLNVLDRITYHQAITGGNLLYSTLTGYFTSTDPRVLVGEAVLLKHHSITSTIFGPVLLDFGAIGMIIQMFLMGFVLGTLHILQKHNHGVCTAFYSIILAQSIIWLETGPTDLIVFIFYIIGILLIVYNLNIIHKQNN